MIRTTPRTCRKAKRCGTCHKTIPVGHAYLEVVATPNDNNIGNVGWLRMAECCGCAYRRGRDYLLVGHPGEREASWAAYCGGYQ